MAEEFLTVDQLARRWQRSVGSIYADRYHGRGPRAVRFGRVLRYRLDDVERWEAENTEEPGSPLLVRD
jgi:predicted DNA-binding transcriptional regulator AlpA